MTRARRMRGFTLTELMVVATVIGILAAVALPAYRDATLRARRTVAKVALTAAAGREESWYTDRKTYTASFGADGLGLVPGNAVTSYFVDADGRPGATTSKALYSITLGNVVSTGGIVTSWTLTATPQNAQRRDTTCGDLILKQDGTKSASSGRSDCWSR